MDGSSLPDGPLQNVPASKFDRFKTDGARFVPQGNFESDCAINAISDKRRVVIRGVAIRPVAIKGVVISKWACRW